MVEYNKQNYTGAADLADVAYIDNFEFLEAPMAEEDEQLMGETEITLRESKQINGRKGSTTTGT